MYYASFDCLACGNTSFFGPVGSLLDSHRGLPVVPGDILAETYTECDHCHVSHYFGELTVVVNADDGDEDDGDEDGS